MTRKQKIRAAFRDAVFKRDGYRCVVCGFQSSPERVEQDLDAHHITPRELMPGGGYVVENGVSLCGRNRKSSAKGCHGAAELALQFPACGTKGSKNFLYRFSPPQLYEKIGSSRERAEAASVYLENPRSAEHDKRPLVAGQCPHTGLNYCEHCIGDR